MEIKEFAKKILGVELTEFQEKVLESSVNMKLDTGRKMGKKSLLKMQMDYIMNKWNKYEVSKVFIDESK